MHSTRQCWWFLRRFTQLLSFSRTRHAENDESGSVNESMVNTSRPRRCCAFIQPLCGSHSQCADWIQVQRLDLQSLMRQTVCVDPAFYFCCVRTELCIPEKQWLHFRVAVKCQTQTFQSKVIKINDLYETMLSSSVHTSCKSGKMMLVLLAEVLNTRFFLVPLYFTLINKFRCSTCKSCKTNDEYWLIWTWWHHTHDIQRCSMSHCLRETINTADSHLQHVRFSHIYYAPPAASSSSGTVPHRQHPASPHTAN